jgi:hypothetical protein
MWTHRFDWATHIQQVFNEFMSDSSQNFDDFYKVAAEGPIEMAYESLIVGTRHPIWFADEVKEHNNIIQRLTSSQRAAYHRGRFALEEHYGFVEENEAFENRLKWKRIALDNVLADTDQNQHPNLREVDAPAGMRIRDVRSSACRHDRLHDGRRARCIRCDPDWDVVTEWEVGSANEFPPTDEEEDPTNEQPPTDQSPNNTDAERTLTRAALNEHNANELQPPHNVDSLQTTNGARVSNDAADIPAYNSNVDSFHDSCSDVFDNACSEAEPTIDQVLADDMIATLRAVISDTPIPPVQHVAVNTRLIVDTGSSTGFAYSHTWCEAVTAAVNNTATSLASAVNNVNNVQPPAPAAEVATTTEQSFR